MFLALVSPARAHCYSGFPLRQPSHQGINTSKWRFRSSASSPSASNALSDRWTPSAGPCLLERNRLWKLWQPAGWHVCFYLNELIRVNIFVTSNQLFNHFSSVICFNQKWNTLGHRFCWNPVLATSFPEQIFWSKAFFFLGSRGEGAYDVPLLDRIEANEMANRPKVILRIISVLVVVSIYPSTWGGGAVGRGREIRVQGHAQQVQRQPVSKHQRRSKEKHWHVIPFLLAWACFCDKSFSGLP